MSSPAGALGRFTCSLWAWAVPASADLEEGRGYLLAACRCWQAVRWGRRAVSSASAAEASSGAPTSSQGFGRCFLAARRPAV